MMNISFKLIILISIFSLSVSNVLSQNNKFTQAYYELIKQRSLYGYPTKEWDSLRCAWYDDCFKLNASTNSLRSSACSLNKKMFGWYLIGTSSSNYVWQSISDLSYFSYDLNPSTGNANNSLQIANWATDPTIVAAHNNGVNVNLCVTLFNNSNEFSTFFSNQSAQTTLINNLISAVISANANGINIDFEGSGLATTYLSQFTSFITSLSTQLHNSIPNSKLSIDLLAGYSNSSSLLTQLDSSCDLFIIMAYDYYWGSQGSPGPVAPTYDFYSSSYGNVSNDLNNIEKIISADKIVLGMPYYGRRWGVNNNCSLPGIGSGTSEISTQTYSQYKQNSNGYYSNPQRDPYTFTAYNCFSDGNSIPNQQFIDDVFSIQKKYDLIYQRGLAGGAVWRLGYDDGYSDLWSLINNNLSTCAILPCSNTIYDMGGPSGNYHNSEDYKFTIAPPGATSVTLSFSDFDLEPNNDNLKIFDGPTINSPLLATLTGNSLPQPVTASSGLMTLQFHSNSTITGAGYTATYNCGSNGSLPDLTIVNQQATVQTVTAGNSLVVSFSEDNIGQTSAGPNYVSFHLSQNNILTPGQNGDIYLDQIYLNQIVLAQTNTITYNKNIVIPSNTQAGTYYLFFSADGSQIVSESDEQNNFATVQINVVNVLGCQTVALSVPLLQMVTAPSGASFNISASGNDNQFQWQINTGSGWSNLNNNNTYTGVYTSTLSISSTNIGMDGYEFRCIVTNPCSTQTSMSATLFVNGFSTSCNNDYACVPKPIPINSTCIFTSCTTVGATPPSPGVGFTSCAGVPYQTGRYDDDVWFSITATSVDPITIKAIPTSNLSNFDVVLGAYTGNCLSLSQVGCADNNPSGYAEDLVINPTVGTTYLIRVFSYGIGSAYSGDFNICITSPGQSNPNTDPDLIISDVNLSSNNICEEGSVTVSYDIENIGSSSASASTVKYYLSSNASYSANDILLGTSSVGGIGNNGSTSKTKTLNIPVGTNTGTWYILIVADANDNVNEGVSGESNNVEAEPISIDVCSPADIVLTYDGTPPVSGAINTFIPLTYSCTNNGNTTSPSARMGFYVSTDNIFDASDVYIDDDNFSSLSPGETDHETEGFRIPACFNCGNYYIIMVADYQNIVSESDKTNNIYSFPFTITGCVSCSIGISLGGASYQSGGGSGNISVTSTECCEWNAITDDSWITIVNNSGFGNGTIHYNISSCTGGITRNGSIVVNGQTYPITQTCIESCNNSQSFEWAVQAGSSTLSDAGVDVAIDAAENLYMTGDIQGSANFGNGIILTTPTTAPDIFVSKHNNIGQIQWALQFGSNSQEEGTGVATDNNGDIYVIGYLSTSVTFGSTVITNNGTGNDAAFLLKLNNAGIVQWAQKINSSGSANPFDISIDKTNNNIIITGSYTDNLGNGDAFFITKYNTSGTQVWFKTYGLGVYTKNAFAIATDNLGNIIIGGRYLQTITIGSITLTSSIMLDMDGFIAKFDIDGNVLWARKINSPGQGTDEFRSLTVDATNNIYAIGNIDSTAIVDNIVIPLSNSSKLLLVKYDPNGNPIWAKASPIGFQANKQKIITGNNNDIYFSGSFDTVIQLDSVNLASNGSGDACLARVESDGKVQWMKSYGSTQDDDALGIVINGTNDIYVCGSFRGIAQYGSSTLTSNGSADIYLAKFKQCDPPLANLNYNGNSTLCQGETNLLSTDYCSTNIYQWFYNDSTIQGANNSTYLATQTGNYKVKVSSYPGCETLSSSVTLNAQNVYTFIGNGNWDILSNWSNNVMPPSILTGCAEVIINPTGNGECILNVQQTVSQGAKIKVVAGKIFIVQGNLTVDN